MLNIKTGINSAITKVYEEQPWEGYYMVRGAEITNLLRLAKLNKFGRVLEVGCGNGFSSYLMSFISKEVIATDLYAQEAKTHSVGLESAKRLFSKLGNTGMPLLSCSVEHIPFKDDVFDMAFCSHTLHYLKGKALALNELRRVINKDGFIILIVPNFIERIYAFFQFYLYFVVKFFRFAKERIARKNSICCNSSKRTSLSLSKLKENYRYFPLPGPHGAYKNSIVEMMSHLPSSWNQEFNKAGLYLQRSFTTTFTPYPLLLTMSLRLAHAVSLVSEPLTRVMGDKPFVKYFGYSYCVILKK